MMRKFMMTLLLFSQLTSVVPAQDQKHPHDPCPKGTREVETTKTVTGSVGVGGSGVSSQAQEKTKACRPENSSNSHQGGHNAGGSASDKRNDASKSKGN